MERILTRGMLQLYTAVNNALIGAYIISAKQLCECRCSVLDNGDILLTGGAMRMCQVVITEAFCQTADISKTWRKNGGESSRVWRT